MTGYAHHPYTRGGGYPPLAKTNKGDITIATISRLTRVLDQGARAKRIPSRLPVDFTEHGWQTAPERSFAVTDAQQAEYINQSDWIAYRNNRVRTVAQYKIVDDESIPAGFQMGLRRLDGTAKPSYDAYRLPIWVLGKGAGATVYGQVRPAENGTAQTVEIQNAASAGSPFKTVQSVPVTAGNGTFTVDVPNAGGLWRLTWNGIASRQARCQRDETDAAAVAALGAVLGAAAAPARAATFELGHGGRGPAAQQPAPRPRRGDRRERARRRRRAHPRALVADRARGRRGQASRRGFDARTRTSAGYSWGTLDSAVAMVRAAGMRVMLTSPARGRCGRAPTPASTTRAGCPSAEAYAEFARAVATRYRTRSTAT